MLGQQLRAKLRMALGNACLSREDSGINRLRWCGNVDALGCDRIGVVRDEWWQSGWEAMCADRPNVEGMSDTHGAMVGFGMQKSRVNKHRFVLARCHRIVSARKRTLNE